MFVCQMGTLRSFHQGLLRIFKEMRLLLDSNTTLRMIYLKMIEPFAQLLIFKCLIFLSKYTLADNIFYMSNLKLIGFFFDAYPLCISQNSKAFWRNRFFLLLFINSQIKFVQPIKHYSQFLLINNIYSSSTIFAYR